MQCPQIRPKEGIKIKQTKHSAIIRQNIPNGLCRVLVHAEMHSLCRLRSSGVGRSSHTAKNREISWHSVFSNSLSRLCGHLQSAFCINKHRRFIKNTDWVLDRASGTYIQNYINRPLYSNPTENSTLYEVLLRNINQSNQYAHPQRHCCILPVSPRGELHLLHHRCIARVILRGHFLG